MARLSSTESAKRRPSSTRRGARTFLLAGPLARETVGDANDLARASALPEASNDAEARQRA